MKISSFPIVILSGALVACSTGPVAIGDHTYLASGTSAWTWTTGSSVSMDLIRDATTFCAQQGRQFEIVGRSRVDGRLDRLANAEIQFRCLLAGDPRLAAPRLEPSANLRVRVER